MEQYDDDCIGWFLTMKRDVSRRIRAIQEAGGVVSQVGDKEAAGHVSVKHFEKVLKILKPRRKKRRQRRQ
jgi:hypothetical protein